VTKTDITTPLTGDAARLDLERNEHQATRGQLDEAIEARDRAEVDAALYHAIALRALAMLSTGGQSLEAIVVGVNRQLARELIEERWARRLRPAFDAAARAITGQSAAELNAALGLELREHPATFDPSGGHP
jgi:hypothetical protein